MDRPRATDRLLSTFPGVAGRGRSMSFMPGPKPQRKSIVQEVFTFGEQANEVEQNRKDREQMQRQLDALKVAKTVLSNPVGLLAIHIKLVSIFDFDAYHLFQRYDFSLYVRIWVGDQVKYSAMFENVVVPCDLLFDEIKHIKLRTAAKRTDRKNYLHIEVLALDPDEPSEHRIISTKEIHIFEIIKNQYDVRTIELRSVDKKIGECELEFCFHYGLFGYGFSNQFENRQKTPKDNTRHSMYFRATPPPHRADYANDVIKCKHVGYPAFIHFPRKSDLAPPGEDFGPEFNTHGVQVIEEPKLVIARIKAHLQNYQSDYERMATRPERLQYLKKIVSNNASHSNIDHERILVKSDFKLKTRRLKTQGSGADRVIVDDNEPGVSDLNAISDILTKAHGVTQRSAELRKRAAARRNEAENAQGLLGTGLNMLRRKMTVIPALFAATKTEPSSSSAANPVPSVQITCDEDETKNAAGGANQPGTSKPNALTSGLASEQGTGGLFGRLRRRLSQLVFAAPEMNPETPEICVVAPPSEDNNA